MTEQHEHKHKKVVAHRFVFDEEKNGGLFAQPMVEGGHGYYDLVFDNEKGGLKPRFLTPLHQPHLHRD